MTVTSGYVREILEGLKYGDGAALFAHVATDIDWSVMGAHPFAGNYRNRSTLVAGTFAKLAEVRPRGAQLHVEHLIVRHDQASIRLHALVAAKNGMWFDNHYRWIVCFRGEEIVGARGYPDSVVDSAASRQPPARDIESGDVRWRLTMVNAQRRTRNASPAKESGVQFTSRHGKQLYALRAMDEYNVCGG
jgi:ketosteroid isomerase-like protein